MKLVLLANLALVIAVVNIIQADGATWQGLPTTKKQYGVKVTYCTYRGIWLLPGSFILDFQKCLRCSCSKSGLEVADLVGRFTFPEDSLCLPVSIGCETKWVLKKDRKMECPDYLMPTEISAVGK